MPVIAIQGFRMPRDDLSKFLISNGLRTSQYTSLEPLMGCDDGVPEEEEKEIITMLRRKGIDCNLRFVLPWADTTWTYDPSTWVFIAFHWIYFLSNKRIDNELDKPVPASFERLRQMLQVQSPIGQYLLRSERPFEWSIKGLSEELNKVPVTCDECGIIFKGSPHQQRHRHRFNVHGSGGCSPLPDNI